MVFAVPENHFPENHFDPDNRGNISIFARAVTKYEKPLIPISAEDAKKQAQKPWFLYLQGGPGFGCGPPQNNPLTQLVLDQGYQMLYIDQRGTGQSSTITADGLKMLGDANAQADYLKLFRADSIVEDCEAIRRCLTADYPEDQKKWTIFGQSFGGFCCVTYLSKHPEGLSEVFTSGGMPPVGHTPEEVYRALFKQVEKRNEAYYLKYPLDVSVIHKLVLHIYNGEFISLPAGGKLTARRFGMLGLLFGQRGGIDTVHDIVNRMANDLQQFNQFSRPTLSIFEQAVGFDDNVIYALLHEAIYCEGEMSGWAAEHVGKKLKNFPSLHSMPSYDGQLTKMPFYFTGEMIFRFTFETYPQLALLKKTADVLADYSDWTELYDEWKLAENEVPVYAASFVDDMYVDFVFAQETVAKIKGCQHFITNTMFHDAIRSNTAEVMKELFKLRNDTIN